MDASPRKARDVFLAAIKLPAEEREAYLREACADDQALYQRVSALLQAQVEIGSFHEAPAPTVDQPITESPGTVIGPYKLNERIGEGGMGTVWMAQQTEPVKRLVAVKLIKAGMDSRQVIARFEAERQALALMDHPNIARVLDAGTTGAGRPYFVMDLVKGVPITRYCDEHHLTPRQRLELFVAVCSAVQHAHQKGIIHRDLKPSNVLVALYDGRPVPKVIDFGVAKATGQQLTDKTLVTGFGALVGTLEYMSPEQAEVNQLDIDTRSDIYSLGVLLYELLTGSPPFSRKELEKAGMLEMLRVIREQEPSKPSTKLSTAEGLPTLAANRGTEPAKLTRLVRGELDWVAMKALEKDRNRRYETANGFALDVQRYLADEQVLACPPSAGYRLRKFARRNKGGLAVAALVLCFLVLLGSGIGWAMRDRSARESEVARLHGERQAKVTGQVESILAEVDRLEGQQKWPEALLAARRAETASAGGEADAPTTERVRARLKDLKFIDRLEQIRMKHGSYAWKEMDQDFARTFGDFGVDVDALAVEQSIQRLKARPALTIPLAAALDEWVFIRRAPGYTEDHAGWEQLAAITHGIDPEPLRDRLRSTWGRPIAETQDELRRLAESIDVRAHHPATLYQAALTLQGGPRLRLLREAQSVYPGDYWLNHFLGNELYHQKKDLEGAIQFHTAALSVRPSAIIAYAELGHFLRDSGKVDDEIAVLSSAVEIDPKHRRAPYYDLGRALRARGKPDEAVAVYRRAIEARPEEAGSFWRYIGDTWRDQKKPDEAIAVYRQAIGATPEGAAQHVVAIGDILRGQGKPDEAIAVYRQAIEARPKAADTFTYWRFIGDTQRAREKPDEAIAAYRQAIEVWPAAADTYLFVIGDILRDQKKPDEAIEAYRKAIELKPNIPWRYHTLGLALRDRNKLAEANAAFDRAIELYRKAPDLTAGNRYCTIGAVLRDQGKLDEAIDAFRKAVDIDPKHGPAIRDLVNALRARGRPGEAIDVYREAADVYRKAIEADPKDFEHHHDLGAALVEQGKLDEAVAAYRKAIELAPTANLAAGVYLSIGDALRAQKRMPEAIAAYYRVIELDPSNRHAPAAYVYLGTVLRDWGRLDEAAAAYRQSIKYNRPDATLVAHICLGEVLLQQNKLDEAIGVYRKIIELERNSPRTHNQLAWILATRPEANMRDPKQAVALATRAVKLKPDEGTHWNTLGAAQYRAGDWKAAIAALEESMKRRDGGDSLDWFFVAMAHWRLGAKDKAREFYDRAVQWMDKNQPKNEELRRFRAEAAELLGLNEKK